MVYQILVLNFSDIWSFRLYGQLYQDKTVDHISETRCIYTVGRPVIRQVLKMRIWGVPWLVGRYCSYLLPKQAGGTPQILILKTLRMTGVRDA